MVDPKEVRRLEDLACEMRKKLLNLCGHYEGVVHIGGDLSMTDLLIGLYHHGMKVDPKNIHSPTRDRFLLSKGHGAEIALVAMKNSSTKAHSETIFAAKMAGRRIGSGIRIVKSRRSGNWTW